MAGPRFNSKEKGKGGVETKRFEEKGEKRRM